MESILKEVRTMKNKALVLVMLLALTIFIAGCTEEKKEDGITIVAFNQPLKSIAEKVVGNNANVYVLVETDPHTFQLTPKKAQLLENADIYLGSSKALESFAVKSKKTIYLEDISKEVIKKEDGKINPHYWMNPVIMKKAAESLKDGMIKIDEENKKEYEENYNSLAKQLDGVIENIRSKFESKSIKQYVITHPSMDYFNKEFGLSSKYIFIEGTTSSQRLESIMNDFREGKIKLIVRENQFPEEKIKFLTEKLDSEGIDYNIAVIDVLGIEEKDYIKMIEKDADEIAEKIE